MNTNPNQNAFEGTGSLKDKLKNNISSLIQSSEQLRDAIINRNPQQIWAVLADQENKVNELEQHTYLWAQLFGGNQGENDPMAEARGEIRQQVHELKRIGDGNAALSQSYLSAVRKALGSTGAAAANTKGKTKVYGKSGKMNVKKSFLVNRIG